MKKIYLISLLVLSLAGCATIVPPSEPEAPQVIKNNNTEFHQLPPPAGGKVVAAVYGFQDKTGQRKPSDKLANISFAVTQGAEVWVIKALQEVGNGQWFKVVERVGLDNLTKERQIIRQARESVGDRRQLQPMMFAGLIIEGGIVGYDSNTLTGGAGARYLGIGPSTQYRQDVVTVNLRAVSVQSGEVLLSVSTTKTIISTGNSLTFFKFFDMGTQAMEAELGYTVNEPVNYAVRVAIEQAVVELVKDGERKRYWAFKKAGDPVATAVPEVKIEEKPYELVQKDTPPKETASVAPASQQSPQSAVRSEGNTQPADKVSSSDVRVPKEQKEQGVITDWANIRERKSIESEKKANLKPGTKVTIIKSDPDGYYFVQVDDKEGWIPKKYVTVQR